MFMSIVLKFKYLGGIITPDLRHDAEVRRRVGLAGFAFNLLKDILARRDVRLDVRAERSNSGPLSYPPACSSCIYACGLRGPPRLTHG